MKYLFTLLIALLLTTTAFAQQSVDPTQDPTALGIAFFKSLLDEDSTTLGKLITNDFSFVRADGETIDGDALTQEMGDEFVVGTAAVSDIETRQYNSDAAVMTGIWKANGSLQGQAFDTTVAFSVVSVKVTGSWKIVNVQFTAAQ
ncbi:nuclear transport factor 2 family protein [Spirosoma sp.]|uniref:nuclear transport factor 2 family protein n=1 Tax=Spirosoma sp. TaxID=1899569 RepID=UPI003B3BD959